MALEIRKYTDFDELFQDARMYIANDSRWRAGGGGDALVRYDVGYTPTVWNMGYVRVLTDDGDVDAYVCNDTPENAAKLLAHWNAQVDAWIKDGNDKRQYPDDLDTFLTEWWLPEFGRLGMTIEHVCLWG